jgi:hypothetical protein
VAVGQGRRERLVKIGTKDPTVEIDAVTVPLAMHVTLGAIETDKDRLISECCSPVSSQWWSSL